MTPPKPGPRPRSASPAERSEEFAAHQQKLKDEAAERRRVAEANPTPKRKPRPSASRG
ncbi:hypothetical protein OJ997_02945 [Solirubrobacter phytolaccae]|uniref:Uncharacterized protein n=1 Tax=Solirubrobacter phytolaccae TaxID=1404360 RepID=A0A9X3S7J7_9ACTN|nr:hypothetical protein [Solirubrobacter phytolaccae]MDA0179241.1 hypothetical protein [Solirubrobacter phytolaccae]